MKLLQKTSRSLFLFTAILLIVGGGLIYLLMTSIMEEEISEKLHINKERIVARMKQGEEVPQLPPDIVIRPLDSSKAWQEQISLKDTVLYDPIEQESELFREISSVESINGRMYRITMRQVTLDPHDYLNSIGISIAIVMILLLLGLFMINRRISRSVWKPFYENLSILKSYSLEQNKPIQLKPTSIVEFKELNRAIEKLTEKIRSDYHTLKEFTENAAHEMQTPLAIIQTKLELVIQEPELSENQAVQINAVLNASHRLSRLNQTLLLITKIENHQFSNTESIDGTKLIQKILEQYKDFIQSKELSVEKELEPMRIEANPSLVEMMVSNLLNNAVKYNYQGGALRIMLKRNTLILSNTGKPLNQPPERMFERFVKADQSSRSAGLGLSIVKKVCDSNGWSVDYYNTNNWHTLQIMF